MIINSQFLSAVILKKKLAHVLLLVGSEEVKRRFCGYFKTDKINRGKTHL